MNFTEKQILPPIEWDKDRPVLQAPKELLEAGEIEFVESFEPTAFEKAWEDMNKEQEMTILFPPMFIQSRCYSVYRAKDVIPFKGYLSRFELLGTDEGGQPQAVLTIKVTDHA